MARFARRRNEGFRVERGFVEPEAGTRLPECFFLGWVWGAGRRGEGRVKEGWGKRKGKGGVCVDLAMTRVWYIEYLGLVGEKDRRCYVSSLSPFSCVGPDAFIKPILSHPIPPTTVPHPTTLSRPSLQRRARDRGGLKAESKESFPPSDWAEML